ncbi:MAG: hypothetical protein QOJ32_601 [Frankiaceae bacterium]|jgi:uncharacterized membrane protein YidH (DUF202 family)|nr:hypothetical protein [Frankiaceae bacterium]
MTEAQWRGGRGLQPERTALAWQRTTLGLLGNGGLFALRSEELGRRSTGDYIVVTALVVLAIATAIAGRRRERLLSQLVKPPQLVPRREVTVLGWALAVVCAGAVVVLLLAPA